MEDFEAPPMLPVALDANGQPWENKPNVRIQNQLDQMSLKDGERSLIEGALAEHSWMKLIDRLNTASLSEDDRKKSNQIISFIERNVI